MPSIPDMQKINKTSVILQLLAIIVLLFFARLYNYLLFHSLAEIFCVAVALGIFIVAWNARRYLDNHYFLVIGAAFFAAAIIDVFHFLSYQGMGVFPENNPNLPTQLWLASRYITASSFLIAPFFIRKKIRPNVVLLGYTAAAAVFLAVIFYGGIFPDAFVSGRGLTSFKVFSEYSVIAAFILSLVFLRRRKEHFNKSVYSLIAASLILSIAAELSFTLYSDVYGIFNFIGHELKIIAFFLAYLGLVEIALTRPYRLLFKNLKDSETALRESESRYKSIVEASPDAIIIHKKGQIVYVNPAGIKIFGGKSEQQIVNTNFLSYIDAAHKVEVAHRMKELEKTGKDKTFNQSRLNRLDGETIDIEAFGTTIEFQGEPVTQTIIRNITEKTRAERELSETQNLYQAVVEDQTELICRISPSGAMTFANEAYCRYYGLRKDELVGGKYYDHLTTEDARLFYTFLLQLTPQKAIDTIEYKTVVNGENRWLSWTARALFSLDCRLQEYQCVGRDITEKKEIEERLLKSESRYRGVVEDQTEFICRYSPDGRIVFANRAFAHFFNKKPDEVVGANFFDYAGNGQLAALKNSIANLRYEEQTNIRECELYSGSACYKCIQWTSRGIFDDKRKLAEVQSVGKDITDRKRAEKARKIFFEKIQRFSVDAQRKAVELERLADDLKKFRLAVDNASDLVVITDKAGKIIYANKASENITGYREEEMIGNNLSLWGNNLCQPIGNNETYCESVWNFISSDNPGFVGEVSNVRKNGEKYISDLHLSPVYNDSGQTVYYIAIERDITKQKEVDRAKTEFVSLASHQLRTPLSSISLSAELLLRYASANGGIDPKYRKYVREIFESTGRMTELIGMLLNISRLELGTFSVSPEPVDLKTEIEAMLDELAMQLNAKEIEVRKDIESNLPIVEFDRNALRMIFENLMSNAIKYNSAAGRIFVSLRTEGNQALLTVRDTGCGIPEDEKGRIFERLYRSTNAQQIHSDGFGLGLYMIKLVAEKLGTKVWFESELNKGTIFYVLFGVKG